MKIARLRIDGFRGFSSAAIDFQQHAVIAGEPRAGRTDIVEALRRVLDSRSTRSRVNPLDIFRSSDGDENVLRTEVEVTLLDLGGDLEALLDDYLESFNPRTGLIAVESDAEESVLGMRLCYRASYDFESDTGDHWVDAPALSDAASGNYRKLRQIEREALPILFISNSPSLQLRAEGAFRSLLAEQDAIALEGALTNLDEGIHVATSAFSQSDVLTVGLQRILDSGVTDLTGLRDPKSIEFIPDDGSLAGLLRALQPAIHLGDAGPLPVRSHGSTLQGVLSVAEAISAAKADGSALVVIADDFGDSLDAPSSEHMAALLIKVSAQTILTTRRSEVVRAFGSESLIRLTVGDGGRSQHRMPETTDKAERATRRLALEQLLGALTSRIVVLVEGPLDAEGYGTLAGRLASSTGEHKHSLPANGIRLVSPPGSDGGVSRLPGIAKVALDMGFHVRAIVDNDKIGVEDPAVTELGTLVEQLVILPLHSAVEAALIRGVLATDLRNTVSALQGVGMPPLPEGIGDADIAGHLIKSKVLKKQGIHVAWVQSLTKQPPLGRAVIEAITSEQLGRILIPDVAP